MNERNFLFTSVTHSLSFEAMSNSHPSLRYRYLIEYFIDFMVSIYYLSYEKLKSHTALAFVFQCCVLCDASFFRYRGRHFPLLP